MSIFIYLAIGFSWLAVIEYLTTRDFMEEEKIDWTMKLRLFASLLWPVSMIGFVSGIIIGIYNQTRQ